MQNIVDYTNTLKSLESQFKGQLTLTSKNVSRSPTDGDETVI